MAGLSSPGIGSGLDINTLVSKLMAAEQKPLTDLATKEAKLQAKITAYGSFKGAMSAFQTSVSNLNSASLYAGYSTSASASGFFSSSASTTATAGSYSLQISQLAQSQKLATSAFADTTSAIGTGSVTFEYGTYNSGTNVFTTNAAKATQTVTIDAAHNSLGGIRDAINAANVGVTASITNDGTGYRLVLSSKDTGDANSLRVSVDNGSLSSLTYDPTGVKNMTQTMAAQNALLTVDGMALSKSSNAISDAISGVTLNLTQTTTAPVTLTVARDTASVVTAVSNFVKAYNDAQSSIKSLTAYNAGNKTAATLTGDATLRTVQNQMRSILTTPISTGGGGLTTMSEIGVSFQKDGTLALNSSKLQAALADPTKDVSTLFAAVGKPTDSLINYTNSTSATKGGSYAVNISRAATQGTLTGSAAPATPPATSYTVDGTNNTLNVVVDGTSAAITLTSGTYTATALAAEVQSKINGASALSSLAKSVSVGYSGTQGYASGSAAAGLVINGGNNVLNVSVDGIAVTATLTAGTYTAASLAAEVQNRINAALALASPGTSLVASTSPSGKITLTSDTYGATSSVSVTGGSGVANLLGTATSTAGTGSATMVIKSTNYGASTNVSATGNAVATLLGGAPVSAAGVDVAGTIGGSGATGSGQLLTSTSGDSAGLSLRISGSTTGSRGTVAFAAGYASQLSTALSNILSSTGTIDSRVSGIQASIAAIAKQRDVLSDRLADLEKRYRAQFGALDTLVASMQQTASFLTQQITSLTNNPIVIK